MVGEIWVARARGQEGEVETSAPCTQTTVIARVSSILATTVITLWFYPVLPPKKDRRNPRHPRMMMILEMSLGSSSWKAWAAINSRHGMAWPMFPGDGDQWVEMYSNNVPEWLDFHNFFCGIQHFKQNWNSYGNQRWAIIDWYQWCWVLIAVGQTWLIHGQIIAWTSINMQSRFCPWNCLDEVLFPRITLEALVAIPSSLRRHKHLGHSCGFAKKFV